MPRTCLAVVLTLALLLSGCTKPGKDGELWVKGLTLPPGSINVSTIGGETDSKVLMVSFDNPGGWQAVQAHFDTQLQAAGFEDFTAELNQMMDGVAPPGGDTGKMYRRGAGLRRQIVMFDDLKGSMQAKSADPLSTSMQQFMLTVTFP